MPYIVPLRWPKMCIRDSSCDVLKLGHHGSSSSTDEEILRLTRPSLAIASCGADNSYGHPHEEVVELLEAEGITLLRTDERGTIELTLPSAA